MTAPIDDGIYVLDAPQEQADLIKRGTWDIPASNVDELRAYLARRGTTVEQFKALPVYRWHLDDMPWLADL